MTPLVSVIMSVYNSEAYLCQAIESILVQNLGDFEFVIVNDGSTDKSREIIAGFSDRRIKIYDNDMRLGLTKSLNRAIGLSEGKYIARIDADDLACPDRFSAQVDFLEKHQHVGIVGSSFYEIDGDNKVLGEVYLPEEDAKIRKQIFRSNPFCHSTVMIPKMVIEDVGYYNETYQYAQDYELWFRILGKCEGYNLKELLSKRRKHKAALTKRKIQLQSHFAFCACVGGMKLISPSVVDRLWLSRYWINSKMPLQLLLLLDNLRWHNRQFKRKSYYIRGRK